MKNLIIILGLLVVVGAGCNSVMYSPNIEEEKKIDISTVFPKSSSTIININEKIMTTTASDDKSTSTSEETQPAVKVINKDILEMYDQAVLKTNLGDITVQFYNSDSPNTVKNFLELASKNFYNGTTFHRVIKDFMIQGGDPLSKEDNRLSHGKGGPGYKFADEFNSHKLVRGSLAMANAGPNTNGSQFFIVTAPSTAWLDGKHTNFGYVVSGMDVVEKIEKVSVDSNNNPLESVIVNSITLQKK